MAALSLATDLGLGQPLEHELGVCLSALELADRLGCAAGGALRRLLRRAAGPPGLHRGRAVLRELGRRRRDPLPAWCAGARPGVRALRGRALSCPPAGGRQAAARARAPGRQAAGRAAGGSSGWRRRTCARAGGCSPGACTCATRSSRALGQVTDALGRQGRAGGRGRGADLAAAADRARRARLRRDRPGARSRGGDRGAQAAPRPRLRPGGRRCGARRARARCCARRTSPTLGSASSTPSREPVATISSAGLELVARAFGEFADLKLGVPARALRAGWPSSRRPPPTALGCSRAEISEVRAAGFLHDLGRVAVPNGIWDKPGAVERGRAGAGSPSSLLHRARARALAARSRRSRCWPARITSGWTAPATTAAPRPRSSASARGCWPRPTPTTR